MLFAKSRAKNNHQINNKYLSGLFLEQKVIPGSSLVLKEIVMRKKLSIVGILIMLVFKYPPIPKLRLFHKIEIVQTSPFSIRQLALQFHIN